MCSVFDILLTHHSRISYKITKGNIFDIKRQCLPWLIQNRVNVFHLLPGVAVWRSNRDSASIFESNRPCVQDSPAIRYVSPDQAILLFIITLVYMLPLFLMLHSGRAEPPRDLMSARQPLGELSMNVDKCQAPGIIHRGGIENRSLQTETLVSQVFIQIIILVIHLHFLAGCHVLDCVIYILCRSWFYPWLCYIIVCLTAQERLLMHQ